MVTSTITFRTLALALALTGLVLAPLGARAQSVLYITDGDSSSLQAIDTSTGNILFTATTSSLAYPIAVRDSIQLGHRVNSGLTGEYDLITGALIGNLETPAGTYWDQALDGAASLTKNYAVAWPGSSTTPIYETAPDWSNATLLFNATQTDVFGITFDSTASTLWIADYTHITQYSLAGTQLSQFSHNGSYGGLAYQASTDTLWLVPNTTSAALLQYSKTGTLLQSLTVTGRSGNVYGAEFSAIPEPSTYALLALGGGLLWLAARRRRA